MARILVVEDNLPSLELMSYLLRSFGHEVATARDGEEGVRQAERRPPDVVLCDIELPVLDGYAVVGRLKPQPAFAAVPFVAVTAFAMVGDRERVVAAGFDGYISKPIDPETFVGHVMSFLPTAAGEPGASGPA